MSPIEPDEIELDPLGLQRGNMMIKNPPRTQPWEETLRLELLPWTQSDPCQCSQMKRGPLEVCRCHRRSNCLICAKDVPKLLLSWIRAEIQQRPETIGETSG